MAERLQGREPRQHQLAELTALTGTVTGNIGLATEQGLKVRQQLTQESRLIRAAAIKHREMAGNLLQAEDVRISHGSCRLHDPGKIDHAVVTLAPVYVPAKDPNHLTPARMKDWTNGR